MITEDIQERQKQSNKDRVNNVYKLNKNYEIVEKFQSCSEAESLGHGWTAHINDCCNLKNQSHNGFYWCYEKDYSEKWIPPLHNRVYRVIAEVDSNHNIIRVFRNKDECVESSSAYKKLIGHNKKMYETIECKNKIYTFISRDDYYNFILK